MKKKSKTLWELACEYESEHGGGMPRIFNFLAGIHTTTDEAANDLAAAWQRYNKQMEDFAKYNTTKA